MRSLGVLALILLVGCTTGPTIEELEAEAVITGDWSAVEKRERTLRAHSGPKCPDGQIMMCREYSVQEICSCLAGR
jgi:hypothetical protein